MIGVGVASPYTSKVFTCRALGCGASEPGRPFEPPGWGYSKDGSQRCPVHHQAETEATFARVNAEREAFYARLRAERPVEGRRAARAG